MEYTSSPIHIIAKLSGCDSTILNDKKTLSIYTREAAKELDFGEIKSSFFLLNPVGSTVIILLDQCELMLCTNLEENLVTVDIFTEPLRTNVEFTFRYLKKVLKAKECQIKRPSYYDYSSLDDQLNSPVDFVEPTIRKSPSSNPIISILGSGGGVAKSVLSILNRAVEDENDPIHLFIKNCELHLVDLKQKNIHYYEKRFPNLMNKVSLHQFDVNNSKNLKSHLKDTKTDIVLDISFGDTVNTLKCCDSLGVIYINSAFESVSVDENEAFIGFPLQERYKIFESHRDEFKNTSAIICSGMNPGVVQWMAIELMKRYPEKKAKGCYIVENDTSFFEDEKSADKNTIYTTWYPEGFLDEAINSYPTFMKKHYPLFLYSQVYELEFKVTLGNENFYGCLMPHEEAITLGKMFDMETGFIYKINDHTTNLIKANLKDIESLWNHPMKVLDPETDSLKGVDSVGVLLVFDDMEAYMYNPLDNKETYSKYKTNATYLQVAAGVYGALSVILLDDIPRGIYYVDELLTSTTNDYGKYLSYHLENFVVGENSFSEGDLVSRMRTVQC